MPNAYLVHSDTLDTLAGHGNFDNCEAARPRSNFDEHLARFDEIRREGELAKLKDKIQSAIANHKDWGQFEVWWQNRRRTNTLKAGTLKAGTLKAGQGPALTFRHNDDLLLAVLRKYDSGSSGLYRSGLYSNWCVEQAYQFIRYMVLGDREYENWNMDDWTPSDLNGPHRACRIPHKVYH
jgi:hypothetical protein